MTAPRIRPTMLTLGMRVCAVLMGLLGVYFLLGEGVPWWRIALGLLLLACPVWVVWMAWRMSRIYVPPPDPKP
jgi:type VI protein secretion system component VasK